MLMLGVQVLCVISFLFQVTYPEGFGGDRFRQVFGEGTGGGRWFMPLYGSRAKSGGE